MIYMPNRSSSFRPNHLRAKRTMKGGTVLLNKGSGGQASSYESVADYVSTVGKPISGQGSPQGLKSLAKKLETLNMVGKKPKAKNIKFNL